MSSSCSYNNRGVSHASFASHTILQVVPRVSATSDLQVLTKSPSVAKYLLTKVSPDLMTISTIEFYTSKPTLSVFDMNWAGLTIAPTADLKLASFTDGELYTFSATASSIPCVSLSSTAVTGWT